MWSRVFEGGNLRHFDSPLTLAGGEMNIFWGRVAVDPYQEVEYAIENVHVLLAEFIGLLAEEYDCSTDDVWS